MDVNKGAAAGNPASAIGSLRAQRIEVIGNARLYLGDASEIMPVVGHVDAVITDPPYKFSTSGGGALRGHRPYLKEIAAAGLDQGFDIEVLSAAVEAGATSVAVFFHFDQVFEIAEWFRRSGLERNAMCFWRKTNPMPVANRHYQPELEYYWHGWSRPFGVGGALPQKRRVWDGAVGDSEFGHPTEKPIDLMAKMVINASDPGAVVVDPFMGSGSTGVAALGLGRRFVGIEHDPVHFDTACRRIEAELAQPGLFAGEAA
ncbi:site-specific DNA-methyltransferase [Sphingomonas sp. 66-10]|uniref:DNA-methyltransferase n=1 Tax=Sphingomonas sp. 66-10 TaxID=1895848 RepID=UPI000B30E6FD|nr:site-specific DNA-methyltransferase [Sphingomonas sp. 66-10]